nr:MAG: replication associated protein [Cressdnaviricota sp.]
MPSPRSRGWCFTLNNYTPEDPDRLLATPSRYICFGKEVAPQTGTPHLQGYIYFANAKTLGGIRRILPRCHLTAARGSASANKAYCSKGGDFYELGDPPVDDEERGRGEVDRWTLAWDACISGSLSDIPADLRIRYYGTWGRILQDHMPRVSDLSDCCGTWVTGLSGSGKTRAVLRRFPDAFIKPRNQWWDGYTDEKVVLCDDVDKFDVALGGRFKHWADFCGFIGEVKGGSRRIRPTQFIVTSQYTIDEIWADEETRAALGRRFTVIRKIAGEELVWNIDEEQQ